MSLDPETAAELAKIRTEISDAETRATKAALAAVANVKRANDWFYTLKRDHPQAAVNLAGAVCLLIGLAAGFAAGVHYAAR